MSRISGTSHAGRPTLLTEDVAAKIVQGMRVGMAREHAAIRAGIGASTLVDWVKRGRDGEEPYADLVHRMQVAQGNWVFDACDAFTKGEPASVRNLKPLFDLMARRFPKQYGKKREEHKPVAAVQQFDAAGLEAMTNASKELRKK